jgi:hypothetical protein
MEERGRPGQKVAFVTGASRGIGAAAAVARAAGVSRTRPAKLPSIAWLARGDDAAKWNGQTVFAQKLALKLGLHPDWRR